MRELLAQMVRPCCTECGSGIAWMSTDELRMRPGVAASRVRELEADPDVGTEASAWWCPSCHGWGVLGGWQVG